MGTESRTAVGQETATALQSHASPGTNPGHPKRPADGDTRPPPLNVGVAISRTTDSIMPPTHNGGSSRGIGYSPGGECDVVAKPSRKGKEVIRDVYIQRSPTSGPKSTEESSNEFFRVSDEQNTVIQTILNLNALGIVILGKQDQAGPTDAAQIQEPLPHGHRAVIEIYRAGVTWLPGYLR